MPLVHTIVTRHLPYRKADEVTDKIESCDVFEAAELRGKHIPAHFMTDLGASASQLTRIERELNKYGAVLVR